jgi:phosphate transport system substrate-binding protein
MKRHAIGQQAECAGACSGRGEDPAARRPLVRVGPAVALAAAALLAGCSPADRDVTRGVLRVAGSDTAYPFMQVEADSFVASYPKSRIEVTGGGSVAGLEALLNRRVEVAVLSRTLSDAEVELARKEKIEVALYPIAHDGLAVIVHPSNPVYAMSFSEAKGVFAGEIADWSELGGGVGPIRVYVSGVQGGAEGFVREVLLDGEPFVKGAGRGATTAALVDSVAAHEDAIGYAGSAEIDERVKALPLSPKGGGPLTVLDMETVYKKQYPLVRTVYCATRGIPRDDLISGFVSFVMSTRGQKIALDAGFVPATVALHVRREG